MDNLLGGGAGYEALGGLTNFASLADGAACAAWLCITVLMHLCQSRAQGMRSLPLVSERSSWRHPPRRSCAFQSSLRPRLRGCGMTALLALVQMAVLATRCHGSRRHAPLHALSPSPRQTAQLGQQCRRSPLRRWGALLRRTLKSAPLLPSGRLRLQLQGVQKRQLQRLERSQSFQSWSSCID